MSELTDDGNIHSSHVPAYDAIGIRLFRAECDRFGDSSSVAWVVRRDVVRDIGHRDSCLDSVSSLYLPLSELSSLAISGIVWLGSRSIPL